MHPESAIDPGRLCDVRRIDEGQRFTTMTASRNKGRGAGYVGALDAFDMVRLQEIFAPEPKIWGVLGHSDLDVAEPV